MHKPGGVLRNNIFNDHQLSEMKLIHFILFVGFQTISRNPIVLGTDILTSLDVLFDLNEKVSMLNRELSLLSIYPLYLREEAPEIVRDCAIRLGVVLEKHFQKLKQNCDLLEYQARNMLLTTNGTTHYKNVHFYPAKNLLDYNLNLTFSQRHEAMVNPEGTSVHIPTDIYNGSTAIVRDLHWTKNVEAIFNSGLVGDVDNLRPTWQYVALASGVLRLHPMSPFSMSSVYDARLQDWYIDTATSSKSVIIALDSSGSVTGSVYKLIRQTAVTLLDTLNDKDFVRIVFFNDHVHPLISCGHEKNLFVRTTVRNQQALRHLLWQPTHTKNIANFQSMFSTAYDNFRKERSRRGAHYTCTDILMVVTDGGEGNTETMFSHLESRKQVDNQVRVFTYVEGPASYVDYHMLWVACHTRGLFHRVPSMEAVHQSSVKYVQVLSRPLAIDYHKTYKMSEAFVQRWTAGQLGLVWSLTCPIINGTPGKPEQGNELLGVTGVDVVVRDISKFLLMEKIGPSSQVFVMNSRGNLQFHPLLNFFANHDLEHHQLNVHFTDAFTFRNYSHSVYLVSKMLTSEKTQTQSSPIIGFSAELYLNFGLYAYKKKALFDIFRYQESRFHETLHIGLAHFSEKTVQMNAFTDSFFLVPSVIQLLSRAISSNCQTSQTCVKLFISAWPYCPSKLNWTDESQPEPFLKNLLDLLETGVDPDSCNFVHDLHDDSQMLQNLLSSLYLVDRFFSLSPGKSSQHDFLITFGGASATFDANLSRSDWWRHVANPRRSLVYQRTVLLSDIFEDDEFTLFSANSQPVDTNGAQCAGINSRITGPKPGYLIASKKLNIKTVGEVGVFGQFLNAKTVASKAFDAMNEVCGFKNSCYLVDDGGFVIGFLDGSQDLQDISGIHLSNHNECVMSALIQAGYFEKYIYEDAFCFCPSESASKTSPKSNVASNGHKQDFISGLSTSAFSVISSLFSMCNFLLWSSCDSLFFNFASGLSNQNARKPRKVLFNVTEHASLCTVAVEKFLLTDSIKMLDVKQSIQVKRPLDCLPECFEQENDQVKLTVQWVKGTNLLLLSLPVDKQFCTFSPKSNKNQMFQWKQMPTDVCSGSLEEKRLEAVHFQETHCPVPIHDLEDGNAGSIYCSYSSKIREFCWISVLLCFSSFSVSH